MPVNKFGTYITHYRSKRKEAAQRDREERLELERRTPQIIDPSFELFKQKAIQQHGAHSFGSSTTGNDDWTFHTRRAQTMPQSYQFEPHCEVTPKSSVSSSNSKVSDGMTNTDSELTSASTMTQRPQPRPQSMLPPTSHSYSTSDIHKDSVHPSRRQTNLDTRSYSENILSTYHSLPVNSRQLDLEKSAQPYKLQASLHRPFSLSEPYDTLEDPEELDEADEDSGQGLATISEDFGNLNYHDDLMKRGYVL